jgi:hypothetical protein
MYPDSPWITRFVIDVYIVITGLVLLIFRKCPWPLRAPKYRHVKAKSRTKKEDYLIEKWYYRIAHEMEMNGLDVNKAGYYHYKTIAQKYHWPYVKELYDKSPNN